MEGEKPPLYAFGHGLSYTKFEYFKLKTTFLGGYRYEVTFTVNNVGDLAGDEVVQLYINDMESRIRGL